MSSKRHFAVLLVVGCVAPGVETVGPGGGRVTSGGASVNVPPGAVSTPTKIAIQPTASPAPPPPHEQLSGSVYAFTPHGQQFSQPVTIVLPAAGDASRLEVRWLSGPGDTDWKPAPNPVFDAGTVTVTVTHFSFYGVFDSSGDAGLDDGGDGDAGVQDAGPEADAGPQDAGPPDAGPPDAGPPDAGSTVDAGATADAGPPDAGSTVDAGATADAGTIDAGPTSTIKGVALLFDKTDSSGTIVTVVGSNPPLTATTSANGDYTITNVPVGLVTLQFSNGLYQETLENVVVAEGTTGYITDTSDYVLAKHPMHVPKGVRLMSGWHSNEVWPSPDGTKIATESSERDSGEDDGGDDGGLVSEILADGSDPIILPRPTDGMILGEFAYSSDSQHLAYVINENGDSTQALYFVSTTDGTRTQIATGAECLGFSDFPLSSGSSQLLWGACQGNSFALYATPFAGGPTVTLESGNGSQPETVVMTPDQTQVVWVTKSGGNWVLQSTPIVGGGVVTLATASLAGGISIMFLSPDSQYVGFSSGSSLDTDFQIVPVQGGPTTTVDVGFIGDTQLVPSTVPLVLFEGADGPYTVPVSGGTPTRVAPNAGTVASTQYTLSPDGTIVCFVAGQAPSAMWCAPTSGGDGTNLGEADVSQPCGITLSGDGQFVAWTNNGALVSEAIGGGPEQTLLASGDECQWPFPASHTLLIRTQTDEVFAADMADGTTTPQVQVGDNPWSNLNPVTDSYEVLYVDPSDGWLDVWTTGGVVPMTPHPGTYLTVLANGDHLYQQSGTAAPYQFQDGLYLIPAAEFP